MIIERKSNPFFLVLLTLGFNSCKRTSVSQEDPKVYEPTWNSLGSHATPEWFKEAKFGIYTHWGGYSMAAKGPNGSWYPHNMYKKGTEQYLYHLENFGHPSKRPCEHAYVFKIKRNKLFKTN